LQIPAFQGCSILHQGWREGNQAEFIGIEMIPPGTNRVMLKTMVVIPMNVANSKPAFGASAGNEAYPPFYCP